MYERVNERVNESVNDLLLPPCTYVHLCVVLSPEILISNSVVMVSASHNAVLMSEREVEEE